MQRKDGAGHIEALREDGYTIVEGAIGGALLAELTAALADVEEREQIGHAATRFEGRRTVRIYNLLARHRAFEKIPVHAPILEIAEAVLDPELQLSSLSAICIDEGQEAQPIHADTQLIPLPRPHPAISVDAMWALTDFSEANGATRLIPGSHRFDHNPDYGKPYDSIVCEMPAGSVLMWDSALWHGGGAHLGGARRDGIACYYCAGWIRQQENQQLGVPLQRLQGFSRRLQELCGFSVYRGLYGHIDNRDPIELLDRPPGREMVWEASDRVITSRRRP